MKKILSLFFATLFFMVFISSPGLTQDVNKILEKMIEAQGGKKILEGIKDTTISGTMEMPQMGISGTVTMYHKEPNKQRMDAEVMGMVFTQAFDGEKGWMINPQTGSTEVMPEKATEYMRRESLGNQALLYPEKFGISFSYQGKDTIEGKEYLVLLQSFSDGYTVTMFLDPETYLVYKTKAKSLNQMGVEVDSETILGDYSKVEGMMVPHSFTIFQDGEEYLKITVTEVRFNSGLEDSFFQME